MRRLVIPTGIQTRWLLSIASIIGLFEEYFLLQKNNKLKKKKRETGFRTIEKRL